MKKLLILFAFILMSCSSETDVVGSLDANSDRNYASADSVKKHIEGNIDTTKTDSIPDVITILIVRVDTIYIGDSVIVKKDTVFFAETDSLFEIPRDTIITDTLDSLTRTYSGVVYQNWFYSYDTYKLFVKEDDGLLMADLDKGSYKANVCGEYLMPDSTAFQWSESGMLRRRQFAGWHVFDIQDAYRFYKFLNILVDAGTEVFSKNLFTGYRLDGYKNGYVGITTADFPYDEVMVDENIEYVCVKELWKR